MKRLPVPHSPTTYMTGEVFIYKNRIALLQTGTAMEEECARLQGSLWGTTGSSMTHHGLATGDARLRE